MIPVIDISALFGPSSRRARCGRQSDCRGRARHRLHDGHRLSRHELLSRERRADLLEIFAIPEAEKAKLLRWNFDPTRKNVYRGWFPLQPAAASYKEGIDMGPDLVRGDAAVRDGDPLLRGDAAAAGAPGSGMARGGRRVTTRRWRRSAPR